ncbi:PEP-CTERM sorting domain-containing protein [Phormidium sp. LEGE 05292]|uniref:choice-of-anchor W domain-containing protein n=1 Tax=[Phormidium] sp. LEGE 05292 TaxID=767427 RepID=UPI001882DC68|nr:choice-of-anchor W domain-containing protein [Phormidium sp. LEGE 05292]MBE9227914.1 PEP-CTERM sorting domain-containing protein [Phormidium sp. LEGE 05292]
MINLRSAFFTLAVVSLGTVSVPTAANAFTVVDRTGFTDTEFNGLINQGLFDELFVAESRIGNNSNTGGTQEIGINNDVKLGALPVVQGQRTWQNGGLVDFMLEYTGSLVKYTVGNQLLSTNAFSGPVTDIFFRTRAASNSTMTLSNLLFNGVGISSLSSSGIGTSDIDYLQISNITAPFTLTGKSLMSWTGTRPNNSALAYQIKVGTTPQVESVPEPGTVGALLAAGVLSVGLKKKRLSV